MSGPYQPNHASYWLGYYNPTPRMYNAWETVYVFYYITAKFMFF